MPREWIEEFQDAILDNHSSEQMAIYYFQHFLSGDASTWFKLSVRPFITGRWLWADLFQAFERNYLGRAEEDRSRLMLREISMSRSDRAANFIPRIRQLLLMLSPSMSEHEQIGRITEKLRPEFARTIVENDPSTVDQLRDLCRKVEAARDLDRAATTNAFKPKGPPRTFTDKAHNDGQVSRKSPAKACHRCGRNNHLVKDCRARTKLDGSMLPPPVSAPPTKSRGCTSLDSIPRTESD